MSLSYHETGFYVFPTRFLYVLIGFPPPSSSYMTFPVADLNLLFLRRGHRTNPPERTKRQKTSTTGGSTATPTVSFKRFWGFLLVFHSVFSLGWLSLFGFVQFCSFGCCRFFRFIFRSVQPFQPWVLSFRERCRACKSHL